MRDIALIGRGFTRVAFADSLKAAVLNMNPYVPTGYGVTVRLESLIADVGWEYAKDNYPEVRRLLQHAGQTIRDIDPDFWLRAALATLDDMWTPAVVTDVRYPNEAAALRERGFWLVRIVRPTAGTLADGASQHSSETALDGYDADAEIINDGSLADLYARVDALTQ